LRSKSTCGARAAAAAAAAEAAALAEQDQEQQQQQQQQGALEARAALYTILAAEASDVVDPHSSHGVGLRGAQ
jgi:hypothetical protein